MLRIKQRETYMNDKETKKTSKIFALVPSKMEGGKLIIVMKEV